MGWGVEVCVGGAVGLWLLGWLLGWGVGFVPALPCWPARLFPLLVAPDTAAPLSTPDVVVLCARSDASVPFPDDAPPGPPVVGFGDVSGTGVLSEGLLALSLGPGTVRPTLASTVLAVCCTGPGRTPAAAAAAPPLSTSPLSRAAAATCRDIRPPRMRGLPSADAENAARNAAIAASSPG